MLDAARIDFDGSGLTIDAACIVLMANALAWTARGLAIDAACIDAETLPLPIGVVVQPPVTITSVVSPAGMTIGGRKVTIRGTAGSST